MKTIIINASPRKNWNTAQLLKEARRGAESVGAETEYIDLYDLNFTGCRSCLACKLKGAEHHGCAWKDDLSMNAPKEYYETNLLPYLTRIEGLFRMALHGNTYGYASCDTLQVKDYSIYDMAYFNEAEKRRQHGEQFPIDMAECFKMGAELSEH